MPLKIIIAAKANVEFPMYVNIPVYRIGIPDVLVDHASPDQSKEKLGLMPDQMADKIVKKFKLNN